jgi:hypothetical protein
MTIPPSTLNTATNNGKSMRRRWGLEQQLRPSGWQPSAPSQARRTLITLWGRHPYWPSSQKPAPVSRPLLQDARTTRTALSAPVK